MLEVRAAGVRINITTVVKLRVYSFIDTMKVVELDNKTKGLRDEARGYQSQPPDKRYFLRHCYRANRINFNSTKIG